ncbi:MAG: DUF4974 domain-containing protein [Muribaculaceae bacterium]|nr:DUF4974 domain-containing protein [Muribaculaceae bacterium]
MEQNDKIHLLLDMHEHPENYTDEQLAAMLDDEMQEHMAAAKRALTDIPEPDVDAEWQRFEQEHFATTRDRRWLKVAAIFLGVIMLSAFTYAAIHAVRAHQPEVQQPMTEQVEQTDAPVETSSPTEAEKIDSASKEQPVIFDNVALETIIGDIAARHQLQVEFRNEDVRALRFYFVWQPDEDLGAVLERLNLFESVNISKEGNTIVVE